MQPNSFNWARVPNPCSIYELIEGNKATSRLLCSIYLFIEGNRVISRLLCSIYLFIEGSRATSRLLCSIYLFIYLLKAIGSHLKASLQYVFIDLLKAVVGPSQGFSKQCAWSNYGLLKCVAPTSRCACVASSSKVVASKREWSFEENGAERIVHCFSQCFVI